MCASSRSDTFNVNDTTAVLTIASFSVSLSLYCSITDCAPDNGKPSASSSYFTAMLPTAGTLSETVRHIAWYEFCKLRRRNFTSTRSISLTANRLSNIEFFSQHGIAGLKNKRGSGTKTSATDAHTMKQAGLINLPCSSRVRVAVEFVSVPIKRRQASHTYSRTSGYCRLFWDTFA